MDGQESPGHETSMTFDRRAEVERLLEDDGTVLGRLFQYEREGLTPHEMTEREGVSTNGWVYSYRTFVRVLRDGEVPEAPTVAAQAARKLRAWLKKPDLSDELRDAFIRQEAVIQSRADDKQAFDDEVSRAVETGRRAEAVGTPGIYVYTLPHYLKYPYDEASGRTLLKVGHSARDAYYRAGSQGRLTALPEEPILLRIYPVADSAGVERQFHAWLRDADHPGGRGGRVGSEWFVTSTKFLDRIAGSLGLEVREVNVYASGDE